MEQTEKKTPVIKSIILSDGIKRYFIDTYDKLFYWVDKEFNEQKKRGKTKEEPVIDLSNLVIHLQKETPISAFWMGSLCGRIDGIINLGDERDVTPNKDGSVSVKDEIQFEVKDKITFENSILYNMQFRNTRFLKSVVFRNARFLGETNLSGSTFLEDVNLTQIDISQNIENNDKLSVKIGSILFQNNIFKKNVYFIVEKWNNCNNFHFDSNTYEGDVNFILCSIIDPNGKFYDFTGSIFKGNVLIDSRANFNSCNKPISQIDFESSYFYKKLKIWGVKMGYISMQNCHFDDTVNISLNLYDASSHIDLSFSTINSLFFIDSDLGEKKGETIHLSDEICFEKALITKDAFIFIRNINNDKNLVNEGIINFKYANILGTITIQDSNLWEIILEKSTVIGSINIESVKTNYDCRESITKIKNEYNKRGDIINALHYRGSEMSKYRSELWKDVTKWKLSKITDLLLLTLNTISNNNGRWWLLGCLFTVSAAFIFYSLYSISIGYTEWSLDYNNWVCLDPNYWKEVLGFLWLPNLSGFNRLETTINTHVMSYVWFILGKIMVTYGIYQTISAFRKYGK